MADVVEVIKSQPVVVEIYQAAGSVVDVIASGPQGIPGPEGPSGAAEAIAALGQIIGPDIADPALIFENSLV